MKFYGNGIVWDAANNKALCKFMSGELETEDKRMQDILIEKGFACNSIKVELIETAPVDGWKTFEAKKPIKKGVKK